MATYREAIRSAMRQAMREDPRVFLIGEDVGHYGGAFAVSRGLLDELGPERIRDAPLSESGFTGAGIGAAIGGMRPIVEVMTVNFALLALDQILNNAATLLHMSGGQISVPVVFRMTTGAGKQIAAQHSHSLECYFAHIPGLKCLAPATVQDARDMVLAALADPDPVCIFEHALLYNLEGALDEEAEPSDPWRAVVRREGRDVTIATYGGSLGKCLEAAKTLADEGVEAEVLDLRSLRPLDRPALAASVEKTRRLVVVDEGWRTGGLSAEIITSAMESSFYALDAMPRRVCTAEVPIPYAKHMEEHALPKVSEIVAAVKETRRG